MSQISPVPTPTRPGWRDLPGVATIQMASFRKDLAYKRWMLRVFWLMPGVEFLVTRQGDTITGCIISDIHQGKIRIMNIAVHPDFRHQGIGTTLMRAIMDARPSVSVVLMVQEENTAAQELYTRLGFARTGYSASYYGAGNAGIEMTLRRS